MPVIPGVGTTAFATPSDLATYLQRDLSEEDTATAELLLELVSAEIRSYTGQTISVVTGDTITVDAPYGYHSLLVLPELPVTAVTSVTVAGVLYVANTDYHVDLATGSICLLTRSWWIYPPPSVVVVYDHGYEIGSPQMGVAKAVCLALAKGALGSSAGGEGGGDVKSESIGNYSVTYEALHAALWAEESASLRSALDAFRPLVVA